MNTKSCETVEENKLTKLSSTRWVTEDRTVKEVLEERLDVLEENKTTGAYSVCDAETPYYDDITCISCEEEFSLDTKQCISSPNED